MHSREGAGAAGGTCPLAAFQTYQNFTQLQAGFKQSTVGTARVAESLWLLPSDEHKLD